MNDREHSTDFYYFYSYLLSLCPVSNFFEKNISIFREKCEKLFTGLIWLFFRKRGRLAPKINVTFFVANWVLNVLLFNSFSKKKTVFSEKMPKNCFWGQVPLEGKGASDNKNKYNLFYGKWDFEYFFIQFFSKIASFSEKITRKNFFLGEGAHWH